MALKELDLGAFGPIDISFTPLIIDAKNYGESFDTLFEPITSGEIDWRFTTHGSVNPDDPSHDIWIAPKEANNRQAA